MFRKRSLYLKLSHPRLEDVRGKTVTSLGRIVEQDLFNESKPPPRVIRSQSNLKQEQKTGRHHGELAAYGIIPTDTPVPLYALKPIRLCLRLLIASTL